MHRLNKEAVLTNVCPPSQTLGAINLIINFADEVNPRAFSLKNLGHKIPVPPTNLISRSNSITSFMQDQVIGQMARCAQLRQECAIGVPALKLMGARFGNLKVKRKCDEIESI